MARVLIVEARMFDEANPNTGVNSEVENAVIEFADALGADFDTVTYHVEEDGLLILPPAAKPRPTPWSTQEKAVRLAYVAEHEFDEDDD